MVLASLLSVASLGSPKPSAFAAYGVEALRQIRRDLYLPQSGLYAESATSKGPDKPAFAWSAAVWLSALDAAAAYDPTYKTWLAEYADRVSRYWDPTGPVAGFNSVLPPGSTDRYYDDNEWLAIALLEASVVLGDAKYATRASDAIDFALSGETDALGGGIFWRESKKLSKNTCSNAPAVVALLNLYKAGKMPDGLVRATAIYDWVNKNLRDPETRLYWDHVDVDGKVEKTFWSYNSAMMLKANCLLYLSTSDEKYAERARLIEDASRRRWVEPDGSIADGAPFAHMLLEAWLMRISACPRRNETIGATNTAIAALENLHRRLKDRNGHYPKRWDGKSQTLDRWNLIDQASAVRAYFEMALYLRARAASDR